MCVPGCPCCVCICGRYNKTIKVGTIPLSAISPFICERCRSTNCHAVVLQDIRKCHCCFIPMPCCEGGRSQKYIACSNCRCLIDGANCPKCQFMGREGVFCGNCGERKRPRPQVLLNGGHEGPNH
ncbi:hypothetical protein CDIK_1004 [Cucumispora dikerogammari]|nr:hypothetical protein CDIK_1004 [Cucumispora dikerogammari]